MFGRPENISVQMFYHSFGYHFKPKPVRVILAPKSRAGRDTNHPPNARNALLFSSDWINSICQSFFRVESRLNYLLCERRNLETASISVIFVMAFYSFFDRLLKIYKIEKFYF